MFIPSNDVCYYDHMYEEDEMLNHILCCKSYSKLIRVSVPALFFMLSGCASEVFRVDPILQHEMNSDKAKSAETDLKFKPIDVSAWSANSADDRNSKQRKIMRLSDAICEDHKGDIFGTSAGINLSTGVGSTVLSSLATVVTGGAARNYSAGATILNGTRTAISAEVYQGLLTSAIVKAIEESREKKRNEIIARQSQKINSYSLDDAILDAQDYHFRCSFYHGIVVLTSDPKKRTQETREELLARADKLREEIKKTDGLTQLDAAARSQTKDRINQGINKIIDKLNALE